MPVESSLRKSTPSQGFSLLIVTLLPRLPVQFNIYHSGVNPDSIYRQEPEELHSPLGMTTMMGSNQRNMSKTPCQPC